MKFAGRPFGSVNACKGDAKTGASRKYFPKKVVPEKDSSTKGSPKKEITQIFNKKTFEGTKYLEKTEPLKVASRRRILCSESSEVSTAGSVSPSVASKISGSIEGSGSDLARTDPILTLKSFGLTPRRITTKRIKPKATDIQTKKFDPSKVYASPTRQIHRKKATQSRKFNTPTQISYKTKKTVNRNTVSWHDKNEASRKSDEPKLKRDVEKNGTTTPSDVSDIQLEQIHDIQLEQIHSLRALNQLNNLNYLEQRCQVNSLVMPMKSQNQPSFEPSTSENESDGKFTKEFQKLEVTASRNVPFCRRTVTVRPAYLLHDFHAEPKGSTQDTKKCLILGACSPVVSKVLKSRRWSVHELCQISGCKTDVLENARESSSKSNEKLKNEHFIGLDLMFAMDRSTIPWELVGDTVIVNDFPDDFFISNVRIFKSFCLTANHGYLMPRSYNIQSKREVDLFLEDFRITTCLSIAKRVVQSHEANKPIITEDGVISIETIIFSINRIRELIEGKRSTTKSENVSVTNSLHDWREVLFHFQLLLDERCGFMALGDRVTGHLYHHCKTLLEEVKAVWPQYSIDGSSNLWLVKQVDHLKMKNLMLSNNLDDILDFLEHQKGRSDRNLVVQKYIEEPLLLFDRFPTSIRFWVLIASASPLSVWIHSNGVVQFHPPEHALKSIDILFCKDQEQCDFGTLLKFLQMKGHGNTWSNVVWPKIKNQVLKVVIGGRSYSAKRPRSFCLFSVDFIIDETLKPWLIGVKSCGSNLEEDIARTFPLFEDVLKVVFDREEDKAATTGHFELIFEEKPRIRKPCPASNPSFFCSS